MSEKPDETLHLTTDPDADPQSHVDGKVEGETDAGPGGDTASLSDDDATTDDEDA